MEMIRDMVVTPKPDERPPCPACEQPAESITYEEARLTYTERVGPTQTTYSVDAMSVAAAQYEPCGHRFNGASGARLEDR